MRRALFVAISIASASFCGRAEAQLMPPPPPTPPPVQLATADLAGAAAASPRPPECMPQRARGVSALTHWDRARHPAEAQYCDALARGYAVLPRAPASALASAEQAAQKLKNRAAPEVLKARALIALGRANEAWTAFGNARRIEKRSVEEPAALHDMALAALATGHRAEAVAAYRALVPRAGLLPDARRRQRVYIEAGLIVMAEGPDRLDEALGYLAEARRLRGAPTLTELVLGAVALALDRQGRIDEARGVAAEAGGPFSAERLAKDESTSLVLRPVMTVPGELHAVAAILAERRHPDIAKSEWKAYLESEAGKTGKWAEHARKKLEAPTAPRKKSGARG